MNDTAGRSCPLHYRYPPTVFQRPADPGCGAVEVLYIAGGLYGNEPALQALLALFEAEPASEPSRKRLVFNGDFHWFDVDPGAFARVSRAVLAHDALRGNVETELADDTADDAAEDSAGCGCAYPDWVGDEVVERSNRIAARLRATARQFPALRAALRALPMHRRVDVGGLRLGIVHGDAESLAGWGFAQEHLRDPAHQAGVGRWFEAAQVDAFAGSHTCLPVFQAIAVPGRARPGLVLNNGAAGMPNFRGDTAGLVTRVALRPFGGPQRRYGLTREVSGTTAHIDAIALDIDPAAWQAQFADQWPVGSDAEASYGRRIAAGPDYRVDEALRIAAGAG